MINPSPRPLAPLSPSETPLEVYLIGEVDYLEIQALQRRLVYDAGESGIASLLLCEHPPTITIGRSGSRSHIVPDDAWLRHHGVRTHWVNRGGGCWLHVPGQIAAYLIVPMEGRSLDVMGHVERLYGVLIETLAEFDLKGTLRPEAPGVFLSRSRVAAVGIAVSRWIAYHGFLLNVGPYLGSFGLIAEPGLDGSTRVLHQTSMEARRQRPAPMAKAREALVRQITRAYNYPEHHVYTEHPRIRKKDRRHVYASSLG